MKNDFRAIPVRADRMLADLSTMRSFGATGTGVVRQAFSEVDVASRAWLAKRMEAAGLDVHVDAVGNVFGLPPGDEPCLLLGSHSDTQPEGGWLDGVYGVIIALEIARASREANGPRVAVVSFQDEEGRFSSLTGSHYWTGRSPLAELDAEADDTGLTFGAARQNRKDWPDASEVSPERFTGFIEMHIEQGPVLDQTGEKIGVVDHIVGIRGQKMVFTGEQNHAGTTPMHARKDAFQGMVKFATLINERFADVVTPATVWTIGQAFVHPNANSIVPGRVEFSMQWRDADNARLDQMAAIIEVSALEVAETMGLAYETSGFYQIPPTASDAGFIAAMAEAAEALVPGKWRKITSGALHDAANVSTLMPMAMMFVPSINGQSHNFAEDTQIADLETGLEVLADAVARIAIKA